MNQRCFLFVPAKLKFLEKVTSFENNCAVIIDLEDSIPENLKQKARGNLIDYLENYTLHNVFVRVNASEWPLELQLLDKYDVGFMLPKIEEVSQYHDYENVLSRHEVIALIESPMAMVKLQEICSCAWVDYVAFGAEDYTAFTGIVNQDDYLRNVKSQIVMYSKAFNKYVIDTPSFNVDDNCTFERDVEETIKNGFDGKLAIHPKHVQRINDAYKIKDENYLRYVVAQYEKDGGGVVRIDGKIYEKMHIDQIKMKLNI